MVKIRMHEREDVQKETRQRERKGFLMLFIESPWGRAVETVKITSSWKKFASKEEN